MSDRPRLLTRRALLRRAGMLALSALAVPVLAKPDTGTFRFDDYPFKLGVASGDPLSDRFVIWTRLAPAPLEHLGGMSGDRPVPAHWEVALDADFSKPIKTGTTVAVPTHAYSVHVDVTGLAPQREYFYRFRVGDEVSPTGRSRTLPSADVRTARLRLAWVSCAHFGQGYFGAYRHLLDDELDLVVHVGDYIYESTWGPRVRAHPPEPYTLEQYRRHHALYKTDLDLQAAHARYPWLVTWDDHEVDNDYAGLYSQDAPEPQEEFVRRRAAAYKAYYEHMPLRISARPTGADAQLYRSISYGDLVHLMLLDNRQYRDDQACPEQDKLGGRILFACEERSDPRRSLLGDPQERWLRRQLSRPARWRLIAQQSLIAPFNQPPPQHPAEGHWSDGWDGYPATRDRLLTHIHARNIPNVVTLGGDLHSFWVADLKADYADPAAPTVATEFVTTSVTAAGRGWADSFLSINPHVKYHEWRYRGYGIVEVTPHRLRTELRALENVADPRTGAYTLKSFLVEDGRAGALEA